MNFTTLTYPASYRQNAFYALGGFLIVTDATVIFKPHSFNLGDSFDRYINIADIGGYTKGCLTNISIWTKDGHEIKLCVRKKDEVIKEIEARRRYLFTSIGLNIPSLLYGNCKV